MKKVILSLTMVIAMLASLTACSGAKAQSNDPYRNEVEKMLELTKTKEFMVTAITTTYTNMRLPIDDIAGMSKAIVDGIWDDYVNECIPIYQKHYTIDDLKGLNEFYSTPLGKKLAESTSEIMTETATMTQTKLTPKIQEIITDYMR
ncbi:DUF2059 domain-containing protein [Muribaculaceae bacterium Isolate-002 (NCI)]|nr:DUF2059 domain-containing protein [Muribaculaceae bacterium Isolate-002 (NCI)]